jgi:hypothetical protein
VFDYKQLKVTKQKQKEFSFKAIDGCKTRYYQKNLNQKVPRGEWQHSSQVRCCEPQERYSKLFYNKSIIIPERKTTVLLIPQCSLVWKAQLTTSTLMSWPQ